MIFLDPTLAISREIQRTNLVMLRRSLLYFRHRKMSSSIPPPIRPANWKALAPEPLPGSITFAAQPNLPRLPVPDLKQTLDRLRVSLKPIAWSDSEYSSVLHKIDTFANDQGPQLQQRLLNRASETPHWLEEWWDNIGYLGYRDSVHLYIIYSHVVISIIIIIIQVVVNVSYYCEDPQECRLFFSIISFLIYLCQMDLARRLNTCTEVVSVARQVLHEQL